MFSKKRLLWLILPTLLAIAAVIGTTATHKPTEGVFSAEACTNVRFTTSREVYPESRDSMRTVVFREFPVVVTAASLSVAGKPAAAGTHALISPSAGAEIILRVPHAVPVTFKLRPKRGETTFVLNHQPTADGFAVNIGNPAGALSAVLFSCLGDGTLLVKNADIEFEDAGHRKSRVEAQELPIEMTFKAAPAAQTLILMETDASERSAFLSIQYNLPGDEPVTLFSKRAIRDVSFGTSLGLARAETMTFLPTENAAGETERKLSRAGDVELQGENLQFDSSLIGSPNGFTYSISGRFTSIRSVRQGGRVRELLPTYIDRMKEPYGIIFAVLAYMVDKLITIATFFAPNKK